MKCEFLKIGFIKSSCLVASVRSKASPVFIVLSSLLWHLLAAAATPYEIAWLTSSQTQRGKKGAIFICVIYLNIGSICCRKTHSNMENISLL